MSLGSEAYYSIGDNLSNFSKKVYVEFQWLENWIIPLMALALCIYGVRILLNEPGKLKSIRHIFIALPLISAAAFSGDGWLLTDYLIPFFAEFPFIITVWLMRIASESGVSVGGIDSAFDALFDGINKIGEATEEVSGIFATVRVFIALLLLALVYGFVYLIFYGTQILSMATIYIFMSIGPVFLVLACFPITYGYFKAWIRELIKYAMMGPLAGTVMGMTIIMVSESLYGIRDRAIADPTNLDVFDGSFGVAIFMAFVSITLLRQIPDWAASLTGGTQSDHSSYGFGQGATKTVGSMAGGAASGAIAGGAAMASRQTVELAKNLAKYLKS